MPTTKSDVITFKVDSDLYKMLAGIPNRSHFIRAAILGALENSCPFCGGTGRLSASQKNHWKRFMQGHAIRECTACHSLTVVCRSARKRQRTPIKGNSHVPRK